MTEFPNCESTDKSDDQSHVRCMKRGNWYWIEKAVIEEYAREVGPLAIAVYNYLASYANANQSCYPSQRRIGVALGYSRTSVNRAIKRLKRCNLVRVDKIEGIYGYHQTYTLLRVRL